MMGEAERDIDTLAQGGGESGDSDGSGNSSNIVIKDSTGVTIDLANIANYYGNDVIYNGKTYQLFYVDTAGKYVNYDGHGSYSDYTNYPLTASDYGGIYSPGIGQGAYLSSPSTGGSVYICQVESSYRLGSSNSDTMSGVRPVVCLPSSIQIQLTSYNYEEIPSVCWPMGKDASTVETGDDITIGTEQFRVLINDRSNESSKVIAIPFYNITLDENSPVQSEDAGTSVFATTGFQGTGGRDVNMEDEHIVINKYIVAYSNKLSSETGGAVTARIGRSIDLATQSGSQIYCSGMLANPGNRGEYWLGTRWNLFKLCEF